MLLQSIGFRTILASNVNDALESLEREIPDLILSDFHLPDHNGLDFMNMIKANAAYNHIPFIMISSSLVQDKRDDILINTNLVEEVIIRPIEPQLFIEIIERIWNKYTNIKYISLL